MGSSKRRLNVVWTCIFICISIYHLSGSLGFLSQYMNRFNLENIHAEGRYQEIGDKIYFSDSWSYSLYSIDKDGRNARRIGKDTASTLKAYGHYLIYNTVNDHQNILCRYDVEAETTEVLSSKQAHLIGLYKDRILYFYENPLHTGEDSSRRVMFSTVDGIKKDQLLLNGVNGVYGVYEDMLYYTEQDGPGIYELNLETQERRKVFASSVRHFAYSTDKLYFIQDNKLSVYDRASKEIFERVLETPKELTYTKLYKNMLFLWSKDGTLHRYDMEKEIMDRVVGFKVSINFQLHGNVLYVQRLRSSILGHLYRIDLNSWKVQKVF